jgi:hypothetical protein
MKHALHYFSLALLIGHITVQADSNSLENSPTIVARSQARYKMREDVASVDHSNLWDMGSWYGTFAVIPGYMQSFYPTTIAQKLFGNSLQVSGARCDSECGHSILIQGSQIEDRNAKAWLADYFYLAPDYDGSFSIKPRIKDFFIDMQWYLGLDEVVSGMYFQIYAPFVHTNWDLEFCDSKLSSTQGYTEGYFAPEFVPNINLVQSFGAYASGQTPYFANAEVTATGLAFAKLSKCSRTKNGLGEIRAEIGFNFFKNDCDHIGLNIQAAAPTGSKRRAEYAFDAVIGNGYHWECGAGLTGHHIFWRNYAESTAFGLYIDANITYLFKAREERTFDLKNKLNSRYMLAAGMDDNTTGLVGGTPPVAAIKQFNGSYTPVANLTTFNLNVSGGIQADIVAMFNYSSCGWSWDLGYNFYGRSKEKFDCPTNSSDTACGNTTNICDPNNENVWVLKGDARVYGFSATATVALSASESLATICGGTNGISVINNAHIDNPQLAVSNTGTLFVDSASTAQIYTSIQPQFITCQDVDFIPTYGLTNAVFTHISYTWDRECWIPYFGIGGFAEFANNRDTCTSQCFTNCCAALPDHTNCDDINSSVNTSVSRWGVWLKGGMSFN